LQHWSLQQTLMSGQHWSLQQANKHGEPLQHVPPYSVS
jgi:hypothetical protein